MNKKELKYASKYVYCLLMMLIIFNVDFLYAKRYQVKNDTIKIEAANYISFDDVNMAPVFAGCGKWEEVCERRNCFGRSVLKLVRKHIERGFDKEKKYVSDPLRTTIQFVIDTTGAVNKFNISGDDEVMNKYAGIAIAKLSKTSRIRPGIHQGKPVAVFYELKIIAKTSNNKKSNRNFNIQRDLGKDYEKDFEELVFDNQVIHPECGETGNEKKDKQCLNEKVKKFINRNFDVKIAKNLGLQGVNRIYVRFIISKCGNIINVESRGPHPTLEKEAIRVVKMLPKMRPAKLDGDNVNVFYSLPIVFSVK
ncbi:energy transducer TonB [Aquimarina sp. Aq107]|uniref:energy transducer TonB n=1 Tax=Aquimarina sp. Aq107 TaxID=1191912 RepID=UPI000D55478C|nr:energy transducer TonB [Aquimarina sp. Aq107]